MAGLEALTSMIYHERQQSGSMLCAQHALNSLLQGNYFTAPDLAVIARNLDALEHGTLDEVSLPPDSMNMDDTGFFSVQVMEHALKVWGLTLIRWRSEQMRPFQDMPYTQLAFVLNLHQHWFTLRRFGPAEPDVGLDPGIGHWYNLNSSLPSPEWIGRTYLGMVLTQAEDEGYSVFAVVQADPKAPLALPRTDADTIAATLEAPDAEQHFLNTLAPAASASSANRGEPAARSSRGARHERLGIGSATDPTDADSDVDLHSEDWELQAALQASLTGGAFDYDAFDALGGLRPSAAATGPRAPVPAPVLRHAPPPPVPAIPELERAPADAVAASMARNQAIMEQMRRAQEAALRESYEAEMERFAQVGTRVGERATPLRRRTSGEEEEEEHIRRAIEESMRGSSGSDEGADEYINVDDSDDETEQRHAQDKENVPARRPFVQPLHSGSAPGSSRDTGSGSSGSVPQVNVEGHRVYDDEDAELQAALRASLEGVDPAAIAHTPPPPRPSLPTSARTSDTTVSTGAPALAASVSPAEEDEDEDLESERPSSPPPAPQPVDVDEMRRRRLARFGR